MKERKLSSDRYSTLPFIILHTEENDDTTYKGETLGQPQVKGQ